MENQRKWELNLFAHKQAEIKKEKYHKRCFCQKGSDFKVSGLSDFGSEVGSEGHKMGQMCPPCVRL